MKKEKREMRSIYHQLRGLEERPPSVLQEQAAAWEPRTVSREPRRNFRDNYTVQLRFSEVS